MEGFKWLIHYPKVFVTGKLKDNCSKETVCADGLIGWSSYILVKEAPYNFILGMDAIGNKLGIPPSKENLLKYADELIK